MPKHPYRKLIIEADGTAKTFQIVKDRLCMGRDPDCDLHWPDHKISRHHCEIRRIGNLLLIEDQKSSNGTLVNGRAVRQKELLPGDRVQIGSVTLHVDHVGQPRAKGRPPAALEAPAPSRRQPSEKPPSSISKRSSRTPLLGGFAFLLLVSGTLFWALRPHAPTQHLRDASKTVSEEFKEASTEVRPTASHESAKANLDADFKKHFQRALLSHSWIEAERLLQTRQAPHELASLLQEALRKDVAAIHKEALERQESQGSRSAAMYLKTQMARFPPHSPFAGRLKDDLLSLPEVANASPAPHASAKPARGKPEKPAFLKTEAAPDLASALAKADELLMHRRLDRAASLFESVRVRALEEKPRDLVTRAERGLRLVKHYRQLFQHLGRLSKRELDKAGRLRAGAEESGPIVQVTPMGPTIQTPSGKLQLKWRLLPARSFKALLEHLGQDASLLVDGAAVLFHAGLADAARKLLIAAFRRDPKSKQAIDRVLADARGTELPKGGFTLFKGRWLAPSELARKRLNKTILQARLDLTADNPEVRGKAFRTLKDLGDAARSSLLRGILSARIELLERLHKTQAYKPLNKIARLKAELDQRRQLALKLIFDTTKYPYPYRKERGASDEDVKNYQLYQPIVTKRTQAVQEIWDSTNKASPGKQWKMLVKRILETARWLKTSGFDPVQDSESWVSHLPRRGPVSVRNLANSAEERKRIDRAREVLASNEKKPGAASALEQQQARITNAYRLMFGRWAVVLHDPLVRAARGHCEDMVRLGFFSHMSKVKGKKTPWDRAVREGMQPMGLGENIAIARSPLGAHMGWIHSPGHHRNILGLAWRIMGPGQSGSRWCQLFSAGDATQREK